MEWFEMESAGAYYTEEGVLFAEHGTCLLAFPAGRTGNYKVPSHVVRFAAGAFDSAQIEVLDATACILDGCFRHSGKYQPARRGKRRSIVEESSELFYNIWYITET